MSQDGRDVVGKLQNAIALLHSLAADYTAADAAAGRISVELFVKNEYIGADTPLPAADDLHDAVEFMRRILRSERKQKYRKSRSRTPCKARLKKAVSFEGENKMATAPPRRDEETETKEDSALTKKKEDQEQHARGFVTAVTTRAWFRIAELEDKLQSIFEERVEAALRGMLEKGIVDGAAVASLREELRLREELSQSIAAIVDIHADMLRWVLAEGPPPPMPPTSTALKGERETQKLAKEAEKEADKAAKQAGKEAEKAAKEAERAAKEAGREAEKAAKVAENEAAKAKSAGEREAEKLRLAAGKEAEKLKLLAGKEAEKLRPAAEKEVEQIDKLAEKEAERAEKAAKAEAERAERFAKAEADKAKAEVVRQAKTAQKEAESLVKAEQAEVERAAKAAKAAEEREAKAGEKEAQRLAKEKERLEKEGLRRAEKEAAALELAAAKAAKEAEKAALKSEKDAEKESRLAQKRTAQEAVQATKKPRTFRGSVRSQTPDGFGVHVFATAEEPGDFADGKKICEKLFNVATPSLKDFLGGHNRGIKNVDQRTINVPTVGSINVFSTEESLEKQRSGLDSVPAPILAATPSKRTSGDSTHPAKKAKTTASPKLDTFVAKGKTFGDRLNRAVINEGDGSALQVFASNDDPFFYNDGCKMFDKENEERERTKAKTPTKK